MRLVGAVLAFVVAVAGLVWLSLAVPSEGVTLPCATCPCIPGPTGPTGPAGATGPTGPAGASGSTDYVWSAAREALNNGTGTAGNFTTGVQFYPQRQVTITGCQFYWKGTTNGARTVRCRIYKNTVSQATVDVAAPGTDGIVTGTFGSPYTVAAADVMTVHYASVWETSGTNYTKITTNPMTSPFVSFPGILYVDFGMFAAGDVAPTSSAGSERYCVDPTY